MNMTVAQYVFSTYELVGYILSHLSILDLIVAQRVSATFKAVIDESSTLQSKMWLKPRSRFMIVPDATIRVRRGDSTYACFAPNGSEIVLNPLLEKIWPNFTFDRKDCYPPLNRLLSRTVETSFQEYYDRSLTIPPRCHFNITLASRIMSGPTDNPFVQKSTMTKRRTTWKGGSWQKMWLTKPAVASLSYLTWYVNGSYKIPGASIQGASRQGRILIPNGITLGHLHAWECRLAPIRLPKGRELKYLQLSLGDVETVHPSSIIELAEDNDDESVTAVDSEDEGANDDDSGSITVVDDDHGSEYNHPDQLAVGHGLSLRSGTEPPPGSPASPNTPSTPIRLYFSRPDSVPSTVHSGYSEAADTEGDNTNPVVENASPDVENNNPLAGDTFVDYPAVEVDILPVNNGSSFPDYVAPHEDPPESLLRGPAQPEIEAYWDDILQPTYKNDAAVFETSNPRHSTIIRYPKGFLIPPPPREKTLPSLPVSRSLQATFQRRSKQKPEIRPELKPTGLCRFDTRYSHLVSDDDEDVGVEADWPMPGYYYPPAPSFSESHSLIPGWKQATLVFGSSLPEDVCQRFADIFSLAETLEIQQQVSSTDAQTPAPGSDQQQPPVPADSQAQTVIDNQIPSVDNVQEQNNVIPDNPPPSPAQTEDTNDNQSNQPSSATPTPSIEPNQLTEYNPSTIYYNPDLGPLIRQDLIRRNFKTDSIPNLDHKSKKQAWEPIDIHKYFPIRNLNEAPFSFLVPCVINKNKQNTTSKEDDGIDESKTKEGAEGEEEEEQQEEEVEYNIDAFIPVDHEGFEPSYKTPDSVWEENYEDSWVYELEPRLSYKLFRVKGSHEIQTVVYDNPLRGGIRRRQRYGYFDREGLTFFQE